MIPADLISKKRDGHAFTKNELTWFINGYLAGKITEAQMTALLMAIFYTGMNEEEIFALVCVDENDGDPIIMLQSPVIMKMMQNPTGQYV